MFFRSLCISKSNALIYEWQIVLKEADILTQLSFSFSCMHMGLANLDGTIYHAPPSQGQSVDIKLLGWTSWTFTTVLASVL
jgi:hypothetical protein